MIGTQRVDWSGRSAWVVAMAVRMLALRGAPWKGFHEQVCVCVCPCVRACVRVAHTYHSVSAVLSINKENGTGR